MTQHYYNKITREKTIYPYRFKTLEEFHKEFQKDGDYDGQWRDRVRCNFTYAMDYLCGSDYLDTLIEDSNNNTEISDSYTERCWCISFDMITKNEIYKITVNDIIKLKEKSYE